ncbi:hypothetical protein B0H10DRAFT_1952157 [Mycena sp. CBHHK59/15]|nr:hypothetical protein B0H10DRAFT_1952157 [Mycena sp. CBHHK59/15]
MATYYHHKFPTSRFLVKPQAFLSPEAPPNAPVNIPPLGSSKIRLHGDKSEFDGIIPSDGEWADSDDEEESFALMALDVEATQRVREVNVATAALMEGIPLSWLPPTVLDLLPVYHHIHYLRQWPLLLVCLQQNQMAVTQAEERANFNRQFATGLHDKQFSGKFKVYPERHPARKSGLEDAPVIMVSFHPETPGSLLPPMGFMTTLYTLQFRVQFSNCQKKKSGQQEFIEKEMVTDWHAIVPFGLEIPASIFVVSARRLSVFFKSEGVHGVWELSGPSDEVTMLSGFTICKAGISKLLRSGIMLSKSQGPSPVAEWWFGWYTDFGQDQA